MLKRCAASDFVVYRSTGASGPFRKLGVSRPPIWKDPSTPVSESIYAVSSVSKSGTFAVPVVLQGSSTAE
ncbi:MAG: hypothetical protein IT290_02365 [Deltaproteobacteria bacterium]|nr:hypothetical protein [Deltaproteobacteria bacterium]